MDFLRKSTNYGPLIDAQVNDPFNDTKKTHVAYEEKDSQRAGYGKK